MSVKPSGNNCANFRIGTLYADLSHQAAQECRCLGALDCATPHVLSHALVQRERFRRRRDHGNASMNVGLLAEPKRAQHKDLAVGLAKNLEPGMG